MRKRAGLVLVLISVSVLSVALLVYVRLSPGLNSPDSGWGYYTEPCIFSALEEVNVNGVNYSLETYMWRDFMPVSPPDGKPLVVIIWIHALGVEDFPLSTMIKRLWLIDELDIASTLPTEEFSVNGNTLEMVFRNGPKWGPGIRVDVVVKLFNLDLNFCIKAVNQPIHRTD